MQKNQRCTAHKWIVLDISVMYKQVLEQLLEKRDLESVLFLRILMETGIRAEDLWLLNDSGIKGREIRLSALKDGREYRDTHGRYPRISKRTAKMAEVMFRYGLYFEKPYSYYTRRIKGCCDDPRFQIHLIRMYYLHIRMQRCSY